MEQGDPGHFHADILLCCDSQVFKFVLNPVRLRLVVRVLLLLRGWLVTALFVFMLLRLIAYSAGLVSWLEMRRIELCSAASCPDAFMSHVEGFVDVPTQFRREVAPDITTIVITVMRRGYVPITAKRSCMTSC